MSGRSDPADTVPVSAASLSDEDLLLRVEREDNAAAAILFDRYADLILGIGVRILHDRGEAEDLVQDVFLGLVRKIRGFDRTKGSARTWIVQIAYRRAFDRRAYLTRRSFYDGTNMDVIQNTLYGAADPESQIVDRLSGKQLYGALAELNEKQRATLHMYFFDGLGLREISEKLGETLENTRHYYYRGLERLRKSTKDLAQRDGK